MANYIKLQDPTIKGFSDSYTFDFLDLTPNYNEKTLQQINSTIKFTKDINITK